MRRIERTNAFKRDYKREKSGLHKRDIEELLFAMISLLAEDKPLHCRRKTAITPLEANGETTANAI